MNLKVVMDEVVALAEEVRDEIEAQGHKRLRVYRWRPNRIELPAIYHWLAPGGSPGEKHTVAHRRDTLNLLQRVAVRHTDVNEEMAQLETYSDIAVDLLDRRLDSHAPLGGHRANRQSMATVLDTFNDVDVLCMEYVINAEFDRVI